MSLFDELKRRNVFRVAVFYAVASWFVLQVADLLFDAMDLPSSWMRFILALLILGFPIALIVSWVYELNPRRAQARIRNQRFTVDSTGNGSKAKSGDHRVRNPWGRIASGGPLSHIGS